MRPPVQSAVLQQNDVSRQQQQHISHPQQLQQHIYTKATVAADLTNHLQQQQQQRKAKLQPRDLLVENHLNFACSATATPPEAATTTTAGTLKQPTTNASQTARNSQVYESQLAFSQQQVQHQPLYVSNVSDNDDNDQIDDDSIRLVDISTSPPSTHLNPFIAASVQQQQQQQQKHSSEVFLHRLPPPPPAAPPPKKRASVISDCQHSRSSSSDCDYDYDDNDDDVQDGSGSSFSADHKLLYYSRASTFDDAAEHFVINFPADSPSLIQNDFILNIPLSETEPLLTNIEATVADRQRSICLSKNSASLIFTKKELPNFPLNCQTPTTNNNCQDQRRAAVVTASQLSSKTTSPKKRQHHSFRSSAERSSSSAGNRKQSKHLPATYHQQQRRSLQLNYNNNLVTTSKCGSNNNFCCPQGITTGNGGSRSGSAPLHKHHHHQHHLQSGLTSPVASNTTAAATRKQHAYSWYAPVYSALEEELEQDSRDSSPLHNLANTKKQHSSNHYQLRSSHHLNSSTAATDNETVALLETRNPVTIQAPVHQKDSSSARKVSAPSSLALQQSHNNAAATGAADKAGIAVGSGSEYNSVVAHSVGNSGGYDVEGPHAGSSLGLAGGPLPRRRRFEGFFKSLVGLKPKSARNSSSSGAGIGTVAANDCSSTTIINADQSLRLQPPQLPASPEIKITRTPSEQNLVVMRDPAGRYQQHHQFTNHGDKLTNGSAQGSTSSLNVVQQKLWNMMRREGSAASLHQEKSQSIVQYTAGLRKCETVLALTRQTHSLCSPVLGNEPGNIGGSGVTYTGSGIFSATGVEQIRPLNRLRNSVTSINAGATCSRCSSLLSLAASGSRYSLNTATNGGGSVASNFVSTPPSGAPCVTQPFHFQHYQPCPSQPTHQRNLSNMANCSFSSSISRVDELDSADDGIIDRPNVVVPTASAAAMRNSGSSDNCARKSYDGLSSSHSAATSSPPPTNLTNPPSPPPLTSASSNTTYAATLNASSLPSSLPTSQTQLPLTLTTLISSAVSSSNEVPSVVVDATTAVAASTTSASAAASVANSPPLRPFQIFTCKLCLVDVECASEATTLLLCGCKFCTECMKAYVEFEISEGAYEISCPDAQCMAQGIITLPEIANLTTANLMKKHHRYRLNREIELDKSRTWCPRAGCETVCLVGPQGAPNSSLSAGAVDAAPSTSTSTALSPAGVAAAAAAVAGSDAGGGNLQFLCAVQCPSCKDEFCSACKKAWHPNITCEEHSRRLVADGQDDIGIPFDNDLIKCCPMCAVPIEKDEGCAQMMCKRCKHVFCWYCLASLDDDFLLRHYDKGPCKNKLGHSRASVVWHRAQVIGIFAGFGILLLVASPLLLLAAPCIICCKCRSCSGSKIDDGDGEMDEATALQS